MSITHPRVPPTSHPHDVGSIIEQLNRTDLHPSTQVNALFSALVSLSTVISRTHPVLQDAAAVARLRVLCAQGETHLEEFWAREILPDPARLAAFPYLDNYQSLARAEHHALSTASSRPLRHIVFAGCGPLPLTPLELHRIAPHLRITCLDNNYAATTQARAIIRAVAGPHSPITVICTDAADYDYSDADVVLVAALVGTTTTEKLNLLRQITATCPPEATLAARSVPDDGRQLLYTRLDPKDLADIHGPPQEWLPPRGVINSLIIMGGRAEVAQNIHQISSTRIG